MTELGQFVHGGASFPLPTGTGTSPLHDADPSLYWVLEYFASVLQTYMGARLVAEAAACGRPDITAAVVYKLPYDPITVIQEQAFGKFPLLAVWRMSDKNTWPVIGRMQSNDAWKVAYVLPPLTGGQRERLQPFLKAAKQILLNRIENMLDPFFQNGVEIWKLAGLTEINLTGGQTGHYQLSTDQKMVLPSWIGDLTVSERDEDLPEAATGGPFGGADITITDSSQGAPLTIVTDATYEPSLTGVLGDKGAMLGQFVLGSDA